METVILTCSPNSSSVVAHCSLSTGWCFIIIHTFQHRVVISGFGVCGETKERFEREKKGGLLWEKRDAFLIKDKMAKWG